MDNKTPDFSGWATVYNQKCTDGRMIKKGAFDKMDGEKVPLVWQHQRDNPENVIGKAILHADERGIYCDGYLNGSDRAKAVWIALSHNDVDSLSIYANHLTENQNKEVYHGEIKEVSVVLAGANSKARVDYLSLHHADMSLEELYTDAIIYNDVHFAHEDEEEDEKTMEHADEEKNDYGIKSVDDCIAAYSKLPPEEMEMMNTFLAYFGRGAKPSDEEVKKLASIIDAKDDATKVKLLTLLSLAGGK